MNLVGKLFIGRHINGSMFLVDVEGLQTTIFDPNITNLFFSDNAGDAEIFGIEGDFAYFTEIDGLSVSGAFSILDSELTKKLVLLMMLWLVKTLLLHQHFRVI